MLSNPFTHRGIELIKRVEPAPRYCVPLDLIRKIVDGPIRNAIENTPDGGRQEVTA